jgi:hypothetical protein
MKPIELSEYRLSQSGLTRWHACQWAFFVMELLQIQPRFTPAPLRRGTLVHAGFEAALRCEWWARRIAKKPASLSQLWVMGERAIRHAQDAWLSTDGIKPHLTAELRQAAQELCDDAVLIFRRSFEALGVHTGEWETVEDKNGLPLIEYKMTVPLPGFKEFGGTLDWVARDREGLLWLFDFKTHKQIKDAGYYDTRLQDNVYLDLLGSEYGIEIVGSIVYQVRAAVPQEPEMNKTKRKGESAPGMSRNKNIVTDWETYRKALLKNGLNPADYQDMREALQDRVFQRADRYYRTKKERKRVVLNVLRTVDQIREGQGHYIKSGGKESVYARNLNPFTCVSCKIRSYCLADLRGHDTDFLRRTEYMREGEQAFYSSVEFLEDDEHGNE